MDDFIFSYVVGAGFLGAFVGAAVGADKLISNRSLIKSEISRQTVVQQDSTERFFGSHLEGTEREQKVNTLMQNANDYMRTTGTLGISTLRGMILYPWAPVLAVKDIRESTFYKMRSML
jgi:hypothetical protein